MRIVARIAGVTALAGILVTLPLSAISPRARADVSADAPPISVAGIDYRYENIAGVDWLEQSENGVWETVAPAVSSPGRITSFGGELYVAADAIPTREVYRLQGSGFVAEKNGPDGVLDAFVYSDLLYAATTDGWWVSSDGTNWSDVPGAPADASDPVEYAGALYVTGNDPADPGAAAELYRFDGATFTTVAGSPDEMLSPVVAGGRLYFRDGDARLWSFDGTTFHAFNDGTYFPIYLGPVALNGHVYVAHMSQQGVGYLLRLSPTSWTEIAGSVTINQLVSVHGTVWYDVVDPYAGTSTWRTWQEPLVAGAAAIEGPIRLASVLTATTQGWPQGTGFAFQWRRDDVPIRGATTAHYRLQPDDEYRSISVSVTGFVAGYDRPSATVEAALTEQCKPANFNSTPRPIITGTMRQGGTVRASVSAWTPTATSMLYQWRRDGRNITNAVHPSYRLTRADHDHVITVTVVGSRVGYNHRTETSRGRRSN